MKQKSWLFAADAKVDHFTVIRPLGRGGMSEVYLARDTKLGRKVALKVVKPEALGTREVLDRFLLEARATARFNHPSIVTIHAVGEIDGRPYVALEYLEGQTLREALERERMGQAEAVRIAEAVAEALEVAHAASVLHRDLKPENVMLGRDGRTRVLDFGLACAAPRREATTDSVLALTPSGDGRAIQGTPAYMAPELWAEQGAGEASDVWAVGVMLFEMLAGHRPFDGESVLKLGLLVSGPEPAPALEGPPELAALVGRCLQKEPARRPTAAEVRAGLRRFREGGRERAGDEEGPFRGMLAFDESHRHFFFGRDAEVSSCVELLRRQPILHVVGPSGAGKSSFVQAGLIPRLRERGALVVLQLRPGGDPFLALALRVASARAQATGKIEHEDGELSAELLARQLRATPQLLNVVLHRLAERRRSQVLLFVDQLEELYTLVADPGERVAFMQAVSAAADDAELPVRVVLTLREEFLSRLAEGVGARGVLGQICAMHSPGPEALREILTRPLEVVGYAYDDPRMPDEMVAAVRGEASGLPLLQFAGRQLWERRDRERRALRRTVYEEMGGVAGALARHADGVLAGMTAEEVGLARSLLLRLVTGERTRRVLARGRLLEGLGPGAERVLPPRKVPADSPPGRCQPILLAESSSGWSPTGGCSLLPPRSRRRSEPSRGCSRAHPRGSSFLRTFIRRCSTRRSTTPAPRATWSSMPRSQRSAASTASTRC